MIYSFHCFDVHQTWWEQDTWNSCDDDGVDDEHPSTEFDFHGHLLFFLNLTSRGLVTDRWLLQRLAARRENDDEDKPDPRLLLDSWLTGIRSKEPRRNVLWPRLLNGESSLLLLFSIESSSSSSSSSTSGSSGWRNMTLRWWLRTNRVDFRMPGCLVVSLKMVRPARDESTTSEMLRMILTCC